MKNNNYKKLDENSQQGYEIDELVDVPYIHGYIRLKLEYFSSSEEKVYANFENGEMICEIKDLKKVN